jgi:translation initiation factor 2 alpha subunit (eIF-2alpha)
MGLGPGYIDLSKRRVSPEDITKCEERFMKSKAVASILRHVASKLSGDEVSKEGGQDVETKHEGDHEEETTGIAGESEESRLKLLYEQIAWPLGKAFGHPYDAFKAALTYVSSTIYCPTSEFIKIPFNYSESPIKSSHRLKLYHHLLPSPNCKQRLLAG